MVSFFERFPLAASSALRADASAARFRRAINNGLGVGVTGGLGVADGRGVVAVAVTGVDNREDTGETGEGRDDEVDPLCATELKTDGAAVAVRGSSALPPSSSSSTSSADASSSSSSSSSSTAASSTSASSASPRRLSRAC
ncbi:uncharacterized protein BDZ99DRAFT_140893 [Mytilinidion resinicola]|uniref:Uncharacterized protein n=1 Tax=Mytilinidion resinicola TaxID=574789 RepID=A0A6A6Z6D1_9PEZI|nr:uncharacterized protein BDZ99DRAFT_140893 [Mytilinidion resinicola]KAF2816662.1 hypothetical protein BDZ99DRAFT_140893 [Mytilinidion resinicola]